MELFTNIPRECLLGYVAIVKLQDEKKKKLQDVLGCVEQRIKKKGIIYTYIVQ